jgi:hypothetical protein
MIEAMTSKYVGARLLSIAGTIQDSKQAEFEISGIEAEAKRLGIYRELKLSVWSAMLGN